MHQHQHEQRDESRLRYHQGHRTMANLSECGERGLGAERCNRDYYAPPRQIAESGLNDRRNKVEAIEYHNYDKCNEKTRYERWRFCSRPSSSLNPTGEYRYGK